MTATNSSSIVRLHLGCGSIRMPGYVNIDSRPGETVDLVEDVATLPSFAANSIHTIYACHVLEHFSHKFGCVTKTCEEVLVRWHEVLMPGGEILVAVPDLIVLLKALKKCKNHDDALGPIMALYGGQNYSENVHYCGFTRRTLKCLLESIGFVGIQRFKPFINDTTQFTPNGLRLSLNLRAYKAQ